MGFVVLLGENLAMAQGLLSSPLFVPIEDALAARNIKLECLTQRKCVIFHVRGLEAGQPPGGVHLGPGSVFLWFSSICYLTSGPIASLYLLTQLHLEEKKDYLLVSHFRQSSSSTPPSLAHLP